MYVLPSYERNKNLKKKIRKKEFVRRLKEFREKVKDKKKKERKDIKIGEIKKRNVRKI